MGFFPKVLPILTIGIVHLVIIVSSLDPSTAKFHPLDQLSPAEIEQTVKIIREVTPSIPWIFSWVTLKEPLKSDLLPFFLKNDGKDVLTSAIPRLSFTILTHPTNASVFEAIVELSPQGQDPINGKLISWTQIKPGVLTTQNEEFPTPTKEIVLADQTVKKRLDSLGIVLTNTTQLIPLTWAYGYKGDKPEYADKIIVQVFLTLRKFPLDNFFAHPLPFLAIIDMGSKRVVEIEDLPIQGEEIDKTNRNGEKVPAENYNFDPELQPSGFYREDVRPINQQQPKGASFKLNGNEVEWQKFKMRIGFNAREGVVLHHVSYNDGGHIRPLIYRAALSEIFVPYGDPRPPFHREMAFDVGEYGLGQYANELQPQIDCKGDVAFLDGFYHSNAGVPVRIKRAICIYEEDVGILWKKTDSTTGRSTTVRSQRLGITLTATLSNYDYQFNWFFYQDASIQVEVKLTGIVHSVFNVKCDSAKNSHNTRVAPNVHAGYHQHFFTFRIDVEFDGKNNTVSTFDAHPMSNPSGSPDNPYGNGFTTTTTPLKTAAEARTKVNRETGRSWLITGDNLDLNSRTGTPKAWKLVPAIHSSPLLMSKSSPMHAKGAFVDYDVWVTPYQENQLYPGGIYLNNSGLAQWVAEDPNASVEDKDIVLWHVFGITHIPRAEDYPVMPAESTGFWLKPFNFFDLNPALDVPAFSSQKSNSTQ